MPDQKKTTAIVRPIQRSAGFVPYIEVHGSKHKNTHQAKKKQFDLAFDHMCNQIELSPAYANAMNTPLKVITAPTP